MGSNIDFWLKRAAELPVANGQPQPLLHLHACRHCLPKRDIEESSAALCVALGAIHGAVGVASQFFIAAAVVGIDAHADRGGCEHLEPFHMKRLLQSLQQVLYDGKDVLIPSDRMDEQKKFIAAYSGKHVGFAHDIRNPSRNLHQQRIADGMIVIIVDVLEVIEIDECQRETGLDQISCNRPRPQSINSRAGPRFSY